MNTEKLIILGSGPAGLTAALYAARAQLQPLIIEGKTPGGQLMGTTHVDNWPGNFHILGPQLMMNMREHVQQFPARFLAEEVVSVNFSQRPFTLTTHKKNTLTTNALIIATGATPRRLQCPGEDLYWGKGVTTCAVCDGAFYRDKKVIIVGGGDTAMEDASFMSNFTHDITIVHLLDKLTASAPMQERVLKNPHIKVIYNSTIAEILGNNEHVTGARITNQKTGISEMIPVDALFVAVGLQPNTALFKNQLELDKYGYIIHKKYTQTSVEGIFAAGDVVDNRYRQAITSAGSGCMAALDAERYLKEI